MNRIEAWIETLPPCSKKFVQYHADKKRYIRDRAGYAALVTNERTLTLLKIVDKLIDEKHCPVMFALQLGLPPVDFLVSEDPPENISVDYLNYRLVDRSYALSARQNVFYPLIKSKGHGQQPDETLSKRKHVAARKCEDGRKNMYSIELYTGGEYKKMKAEGQKEIDIYVSAMNRLLTAEKTFGISLFRSSVMVEAGSGLLRRAAEKTVVIGEGDDQIEVIEQSLHDVSSLLIEKSRKARAEGAMVALSAEVVDQLGHYIGTCAASKTLVEDAMTGRPLGRIGRTSAELAELGEARAHRYGLPPTAPGMDTLVSPEAFPLDVGMSAEEMMREARNKLERSLSKIDCAIQSSVLRSIACGAR
jgi:hypothetical protein